MKLYFAGPLFTSAERDWNAAIAAGLRGAGHGVFLPQEKEVAMDGRTIFTSDVSGIDWAEALVAIMDGPTPTRARRGKWAMPTARSPLCSFERTFEPCRATPRATT
jgi:hypothetical protein